MCFRIIFSTLLLLLVPFSLATESKLSNRIIHLDRKCSAVGFASIGSLLFFAGGSCNGGENITDEVNILNTDNNEWKKTSLYSPRHSLTVVSLKDTVYFVGGRFRENVFVPVDTKDKRIDAFNVKTMKWQPSYSLTSGRSSVGAIGLESKNSIVIAGGFNGTNQNVPSSIVEVINVAYHFTILYEMSEPRANPSLALMNDLVFIVGGDKVEYSNLNQGEYSNVVDVLNVTEGAILSHYITKRSSLTVATVVGKKIFCGGISDGQFIVDILDTSIQSSDWHSIHLGIPLASSSILAHSLDRRQAIFLFGAWDIKDSFMEVYDLSSDTWTIQQLDFPIQFEKFAISGNNKIFLLQDVIVRTIEILAPAITSDMGDSVERGRTDNTLLIVVLLVSFASLVSVGAIALLIKRKFRRSQDIEVSLPMDHLNTQQSEGREIESISIISSVGKGYYGEVYKATMNHTTFVAAKRVFCDANSAIRSEAVILEKMRHPNVVMYLGYHITDDGTYYLITEFLSNGNLHSYFCENKSNGLPCIDILLIAKGVAAGMAYLEANHIVHRDLALRNILYIKLDGEEKYNVKIADFGLSRILSNDYYVMSQRSKIPLRWTSPESLREGRYTIKSDVWSFGILLWEMLTFGMVPYGDFVDETAATKIREGILLSIPSNCPEGLISVIKSCWYSDPHARPTFVDIFFEINNFLSNMSKEEKNEIIIAQVDVTESEGEMITTTTEPSESTNASCRSSIDLM